METEKEHAINNEDYDVAKQLKQQIEFIKGQAMAMANFDAEPQQTFQAQPV